MNTRRLALDILLKIQQGSYSNLQLNSNLESIHDKRDRSLITEIVYGVLRYKKRLDYIISHFINRPLKEVDNLVLQGLRIGIYQMEFLDKIPERAAVNETVNALKGLTNKGAIGFTNAVLRNYIRKKVKIKYPDFKVNPVKYISVFYSNPEWLTRIWIDQYGTEKTVELCKLNNNPPDLFIKVNGLKIEPDNYNKLLARENIIARKTPVPDSFRILKFDNVQNLPLFQEGGFIVQGPAATLTGQILNPEPGMNVLDMAAGPGGKTVHLGELMQNQGKITALDIYDHKIKLIRDNCNKMGINNVNVLKSDGRSFTSDEKFDMILLDAPCSGTGLIRQKPEIKWNKSISEIKKLKNIQREMLENAWKLLKVNGLIVYSTCTLIRAENQKIIEEFTENVGDTCKLVNINQDLQRMKLAEYYQAAPRGWLELFPPDSNTEGFFMAKIIKTG